MVVLPTHLRSVVDHEGAIILDIRSDQFFRLNPVGSYVWDRLLKSEGLDEIAVALARDTGSEISLVMADINDFVADLKSKRLFQFPQ